MKNPSPTAAATQIAPTIAFSDPPPAPPIHREYGASAIMPIATTATTDQNDRTDSGRIAAMIKEDTAAHRTDRVTGQATEETQLTTDSYESPSSASPDDRSDQHTSAVPGRTPYFSP
jgi:hypothetical protein